MKHNPWLPDVFPPQGWKVMVIDDDEDICSLTSRTLRTLQYRNLGVDIVSVTSEAESYACLEQHPDVAVIFLDIDMEHQRSGFNIVYHIRKELNNPLVRIILRSSHPIDRSTSRPFQFIIYINIFDVNWPDGQKNTA